MEEACSNVLSPATGTTLSPIPSADPGARFPQVSLRTPWEPANSARLGKRGKGGLGTEVSLCTFSATLTVTFLCDTRFQELRPICALQEEPLPGDQEPAPSPELVRDLVTHSPKERAIGQSTKDKEKTLLSATRPRHTPTVCQCSAGGLKDSKYDRT